MFATRKKITLALLVFLIAIVVQIDYTIGLFILMGILFFQKGWLSLIINSSLLKAVLFFFVIIVFYSFDNPVFFIDLKYHISFILLFIFLMLIFKDNFYAKTEYLYYLIFIASLVTTIIYLLLYFNIIPNISYYREVPVYQQFRIYGPSVYLYLIIPFLYVLLNNATKKHRKILFFNFLLGMISIGLSGSNQSLVLFIVFNIICIVEFRIKYLKYLIGFSLIFLSIFNFILSDDHKSKFLQILAPMEESTLPTRILDLNYAYNEFSSQNTFIQIFGEGIGVTSIVPRPDWAGRSKYEGFLEIDNGFYYFLHRFGFIGLIVIIGCLVYLLNKVKNNRIRLMFISYFLIMNFLSIHFITSIYSGLFTFFVYAEWKKNNINKLI